MTGIDRAAGHQLLETGAVVDFQITDTEIFEGPDAAEFSVRISLEFPADPESEENDLGWGAFGFLFVIGVLSFADARARESSAIDYLEADEFRVGDFIVSLNWENGVLRFDTDYIRGRRMKTHVLLRPNGTGTLTTDGRGKAAMHWLERLKGEKSLRLVEP